MKRRRTDNTTSIIFNDTLATVPGLGGPDIDSGIGFNGSTTNIISNGTTVASLNDTQITLNETVKNTAQPFVAYKRNNLSILLVAGTDYSWGITPGGSGLLAVLAGPHADSNNYASYWSFVGNSLTWIGPTALISMSYGITVEHPGTGTPNLRYYFIHNMAAGGSYASGVGDGYVTPATGIRHLAMSRAAFKVYTNDTFSFHINCDAGDSIEAQKGYIESAVIAFL